MEAVEPGRRALLTFLVALPPFPISFADAPVAFAVVLLCLAGGVAASIRLHWLLRQSRRDRVDLRPRDSVFSGRSWIWQQNVLNRRNYRSGTGGAIVRRLVQCMVMQAASFMAAILAAFYAML
jgi:hypothetical protein